MNGKFIAGGLVLFAAVFAGALWYFQVYAYYEEVSDLEVIEVAGQEISVTDYQGIDAVTSPNKLRGCFRVASGLIRRRSQRWILRMRPTRW